MSRTSFQSAFTAPSTLESTLSTLAAIHTDQQVILQDVLVQTNTIPALLTSPPDHSTPLKPLSTGPNALHSLIFPGPTIQSDSIQDIIDTFRKLKLIQQKSKNSSDSYIFDYFRLHAPDVFGSLLAKYRIHFSAPHFQFHSRLCFYDRCPFCLVSYPHYTLLTSTFLCVAP